MKPLQLSSLLGAVLFTALVATADPLGTAFTYQGKLTDGTNAANGTYDLQFKLYDAAAAGSALGVPLTTNAVAVSNGLLTVTLDFGAGVFAGDARWLDIAVKTNGAASFTALAPRQPLTPSPYALYAPAAGTAGTATNATNAAAVPWNGITGVVRGAFDNIKWYANSIIDVAQRREVFNRKTY